MNDQLKTELYRCMPGDEQRIAKLAEDIWKPAFVDILSRDRLNYLFNFMYNPQKLNVQLMSDSDQFYLLVKNNQAIGYSHIVFYPDFMKLEKIYVHSDFQGQGCGLYLLKQMVGKAADKQNMPVKLQVNRSNKNAIAFYLKFGFTNEGARDFEVGNGHIMDDYIMEYHNKIE